MLRELLALELADGAATLTAPDEGAETLVTLSSDACGAAQGMLEIRIVRGETERRREILLDAAEPSSRARVAALAIAELVLATRPAPTPAPPTVPTATPADALGSPSRPVSPAQPTVPAPAPPTRPTWTLQLATAVGGAVYPTASTGLASVRAGLRVVAPRGDPWLLDVSVRGATGLGAADHGETDVHALSLHLAVLALARGDVVDVGGGLDVEGGASWITATDGLGLRHEWLDPTLVIAVRGALTGRLARGLALTVDVRAGWTLVAAEVRFGDRVLAGVSGPMIAVDVGVAFDL